MSQNKDVLPDHFTSVEEIQDFWDAHSTTDYWNEMEDVEMELGPELQKKLEMRKLYRLLGLSPKQIARIETTAQREQTDSRQLIKKWVLAHV